MDDGVGPVIAVILMMSITVVLSATVYIWVSSFDTDETEAWCEELGRNTTYRECQEAWCETEPESPSDREHRWTPCTYS